MYAEGETELRDLIIQNLESSGFLNKIKAELRAGVFIAFEEEGSLRTKIPLFNKKLDEFIDTSNGKLMVSLVREFLEFFNLNFTMSVFDPEIACSSPCLNRTELCDKLNLKCSELDGPVLSALLNSELTSTGKDKKSQSSTENIPLQSTAINSFKSLETISEDFPAKEKVGLENSSSKDVTVTDFSVKFDIGDNSLNAKPSNENSTIKQKECLTKSGSEMIDKLRNEQHSFKDKERNNISDIFEKDKSDTNIFKVKTNSSLDLDPFFDEPVPSEKLNYFSESDIDLHGPKDIYQNKPNEKNALSSLKDFPSLTTTKNKDWTLGRELPKTLAGLDPMKLATNLEKIEKEDSTDEMSGSVDKKESEYNEELSDRQLNSEESIEEEIEEDFSAGLDDLLNSSLSLADDATTDQSASQISVVDGIDHIEPVTN